MASLQEYLHSLKKYGLAHPNRFEVEIRLPEKLVEQFSGSEKPAGGILQDIGDTIRKIKKITGLAYNTQRGLSLMCNQTEFGGRQIATGEQKINGLMYRVGYGSMYMNQQFVFDVSGDLYEKQIVDAWQDLIVDSASKEIGYYDDYIGEIYLHQLDRNNNRVYTIVLTDAYPVTVNALQFSNSDMNATHKLAVLFSYKNWIRGDVVGQSGAQSLSQTILGKQYNKLLSNPAARIGLNVLESAGLNLTGEALNIYNQIDGVLQNSLDTDANTLKKILNGIRADVSANTLLNAAETSDLTSTIDSIKSKF